MTLEDLFLLKENIQDTLDEIDLAIEVKVKSGKLD